jgi:hypothetical protein
MPPAPPPTPTSAAALQRDYSRSQLTFSIAIFLLIAVGLVREAPALLERRARSRAHAAPVRLVLGSAFSRGGGGGGDVGARARDAVESRAARALRGGAVGADGAAASPPPPPLPPHAYDPLDVLWHPRCQLPDEPVADGARYAADVCVSSELDERSRRDAIRAGYAPFARSLGLRVVFFAGAPYGGGEGANHSVTSAEWEQRAHGDLVLLPMRDTYGNLTLKSLAMTAYAARCGRGEYYIKADDDVFVFAWRLVRFLEKLTLDSAGWKRALGVYAGTFWVDAAPILAWDNKNFEPGYTLTESPPRNASLPPLIRGSHYMPYAGGPFYILSRAAAEWLGSRAPTLNWGWRNEDMAMGSMLIGADVEFVNTFLVKVLHWRWSTPPLIALHNIDDRDRVEAWHAEWAANFSAPE